MRILVCVKRVPAPGARIVLTDDGQAIDTNMLGYMEYASARMELARLQ